MTELDQAIDVAFKSRGVMADVNKVYLTLLRSSLFMPVKKEKPLGDEEPFAPLFTVIDEQHFMLIFDQQEKLEAWAGPHFAEMDFVELSGHDVIRGINEGVFLCVNLGTPFYKEFSPDEVKRLKMIVARIDNI